MTAQESLHRIGAAFKPKPKEDMVKDIADKLDIELTADLMKSGDNAAITNAGTSSVSCDCCGNANAHSSSTANGHCPGSGLAG